MREEEEGEEEEKEEEEEGEEEEDEEEEIYERTWWAFGSLGASLAPQRYLLEPLRSLMGGLSGAS
eukprot:3459226-Pyramimonas_sp.AAC.1